VKKNGAVSALYVLNIIFQSLFNLLTPALLFFCVAWLFVKRLSAPEWIYAIAIVLGFLIGLVSMVKFIIIAMKNLERLENKK
jgi:mannose/fructose/N-acetylgalactosamine-specific phosphotransferase system component IID